MGTFKLATLILVFGFVAQTAFGRDMTGYVNTEIKETYIQTESQDERIRAETEMPAGLYLEAQNPENPAPLAPTDPAILQLNALQSGEVAPIERARGGLDRVADPAASINEEYIQRQENERLRRNYGRAVTAEIIRRAGLEGVKIDPKTTNAIRDRISGQTK